MNTADIKHKESKIGSQLTILEAVALWGQHDFKLIFVLTLK
jgi:hypothetical protein